MLRDSGCSISGRMQYSTMTRHSCIHTDQGTQYSSTKNDLLPPSFPRGGHLCWPAKTNMTTKFRHRRVKQSTLSRSSCIAFYLIFTHWCIEAAWTFAPGRSQAM